MARTKHFPTLNEYAKWVVKQPADLVLGTAFNGCQYPYELYLSEYYGSSIIVVAGDCYELNNHRYDLPHEWESFTVGYHDSDLSEQWEAANGPQSGIEVTTAQEITYLRELLGADVVPVQKYEREPKPLIKAATIATALDKQTGKVLGWSVKSNSSEEYYQITFLTLEDGSHEFFCTCRSSEYGFHNCEPDADGNKCCCHIKAVKEVLVAKAELAQEEIAPAAEPTHFPQYAPPRVGNFNVRGASVYISDAEMAEIKARVAARQAEKEQLGGADLVAQRMYSMPTPRRLQEVW